MCLLIKFFLVLTFCCPFGYAHNKVVAQAGADKIVLHDGQEITGHLEFLDEKSAKINGKSIERSRIQSIRFADATNVETEKKSDKDIVVRRNNSRSEGHLTQITERLVIQDHTKIQRADVAFIRFADKLNTVSAVPNGSASPPVSPPSAPDKSAPGEAGASGDSNKADQNQEKETGENPSWFSTGPKCKYSQHTYIFAGTVNWRQRNETDCYLYIHVCSLEIRRNTVEAYGAICPVANDFAQPTICCDVFNNAVKTKLCDPKTDADCDGTPNEQDRDPLNPKKH